MSRKDREKWDPWLDADPALRAAWDGFRGTLAEVSAQLIDHDKPDLAKLRDAATHVRTESGGGTSRH